MTVLLNPYLFAPPLEPISTDDFDRANSTSLGTDDQGNSWVETAGDWFISSNQARCTTPVNNANNFLTIEVSEADVDIELGIPVAAATVSQNAGILFRYSNTSNWWRFVLSRSAGGVLGWFLQKSVAGSTTTIASGSVGALTGTLRVIADGDSIEAFVNGASVYSGSGHTDLSSNTKHGVKLYSTGAGGTDWRFDNWSVYPIGGRP